MSWLISAKQYIPAVIGEPFGGGYFAGYISHTADGNPTHALIVAPRESGYITTASIQLKTSSTETISTSSVYDGFANTASMTSTTELKSAHPAASYCVDLSIGGYSDWYLPASRELEIAYFNLKPTSTASNTATGINLYAVPQRNQNYSLASPSQTYVTVFNNSSQDFIGIAGSLHWSSSQASTLTRSEAIQFDTGALVNVLKADNRRVRAFRRIAL
jgi:hypothetical protein